MERQPHPIDARGLPYVPLSIREFSCGGKVCGSNLDITCPDRHHPLGKERNAPGKLEKDFIKALGTTSLLRCQHNELHALYKPPEFPDREVMLGVIRSRELRDGA